MTATNARATRKATRRPTAADLDIDIHGKDGLFEWFLASFLFAKPIQAHVAQMTFEAFRHHGLTSAQAIHRKGWQGLVDVLGEGHYKRYDESTARFLLEWTARLVEDCEGDLHKLAARCESRKDFEAALMELKGVGPKAVEIFMRQGAQVLYPSHTHEGHPRRTQHGQHGAHRGAHR